MNTGWSWLKSALKDFNTDKYEKLVVNVEISKLK